MQNIAVQICMGICMDFAQLSCCMSLDFWLSVYRSSHLSIATHVAEQHDNFMNAIIFK